MDEHHDTPCAAAARGRFWPAPRSMPKARFERFDGFILLRARHLPTAATLALAEARFGEPERAVLRGWAALWRGVAPDVEAFAGRVGHVEPPLRPAAWDAARRDEAVRLIDGGGRLEGAAEIFALALGTGKVPVRDLAFHVLEDATVLTAFLAAGVPVRLAVAYPGHDAVYLVGEPAGGGTLRHADADEAVACTERGRWQAEAVNPDWTSRAFRDAAGREFGLCRGYAETAATLLDMALQGRGQAFLKHVVGKRGTWVVDLAGVRDFEGASRRLLSALGISAATLFASNSPDHALVAQDLTPFTHEHRFFCVGHRVVASTASVRTLAIPDSAGRLLDPRVARLGEPAGDHDGAYDRGASEAVEDRALVARMARAARRLAQGLRREGRFHGNYVIDMGLTESGVAAIEVNTFTNAGLYAVDAARIARSLARWYADPARRPAGGFVEEGPMEMAWRVVFKAAEAEAASPVAKARGFVARAASALAGRRAEPDPVKWKTVGEEDIAATLAHLVGEVSAVNGAAWQVARGLPPKKGG